jgi:hypothetical protein
MEALGGALRRTRGGVGCSEEVARTVSDGIEELARRMLKAAYPRRQSMFGVLDVISPRGDQEVVRELGYDHHTAHELFAAEEWLEERRYIVAVPMHGRGGLRLMGISTRLRWRGWPSWTWRVHSPGGRQRVGCSEERRLTMLALREEIISIICEEWQKGQDRETEVTAAMISEQLQKAGGSATAAEVQLELESLVGQGLITLEAEPGILGPPSRRQG